MKFTNVSKAFGRQWALRDISFEAGDEVLALTGHNGAGKTTILRLAAGLLRPTEGSVDGHGVYVPQDAPVYPELTVTEHMEFWCRLHDVPAPASGVPQPWRRASDLSRGQRQRLHLEMALATKKTLLLDEPFTALDADGSAWLEGAIRDYAGTIIMAIHGDKASLADRVLHLDGGRL